MNSQIDVETELKALGLQTVDKIIIKDGSYAEEYVKYIKVRNTLGEVFYVYLDDVGIVCSNGKCEQILVENSEKIIPSTLIRSTFDRLDLTLSGQVFECSDSICAIQRDPDDLSSFTESIFGNPDIESLNPMGYPVVRLSDLRQDSALIIRVAAENYRQTRNLTYNIMIKEIYQQMEINKKLESNLKTLYQEMEKIPKLFSEAYDFLEKRIMIYNSRKVLSIQEEADRDILFYNLQRRNELLERFIQIGNFFLNIEKGQRILSEQIETINKELEDFSIVGELLQP